MEIAVKFQTYIIGVLFFSGYMGGRIGIYLLISKIIKSIISNKANPTGVPTELANVIAFDSNNLTDLKRKIKNKKKIAAIVIEPGEEILDTKKLNKLN